MKLTTFNTAILTSHFDDVVSLFEDLGFERHHHDETKEGLASDNVRLKAANGFLSISQEPIISLRTKLLYA